MATITSTPTASSLTVSGTTQKTGTISWTNPTIPSGNTITSCVLTGTATASMSKGNATITVNGTTVSSGQQFTINLGTANTTTSVTTTAKGGNKNASGTVSFSNLLYTVTYTEPLATYTVIFKDWDGWVLSTQTVTEGGSATPPDNPTREGYRFTGWDKSYTNINSDITITAQYEVETSIGSNYTVTFKDYDGTVISSYTAPLNSMFTVPNDPVRDGYAFTSWSNDELGEYSGSDLSITTPEALGATGNVEFTAQYTVDEETPDEPGGDSGITIVENFTPSGAGWYYDITDMDWNTQKLKLVFDTSDVSSDDLTIIDIGEKVTDGSNVELSLCIDLNKRLNCLALSDPVFSGALGVWTMYISKDSLYTTNGTTENTILTSVDSDLRSVMNALTAMSTFQIGTCNEEDIDTIKNISIYIVGLDDSGGDSSGETTYISKLRLGNVIIDKLYLGNVQLNKVYLGDKLIYSLESNGEGSDSGDSGSITVTCDTSNATNSWDYMDYDYSAYTFNQSLKLVEGQEYTITIKGNSYAATYEYHDYEEATFLKFDIDNDGANDDFENDIYIYDNTALDEEGEGTITTMNGHFTIMIPFDMGVTEFTISGSNTTAEYDQENLLLKLTVDSFDSENNLWKDESGNGRDVTLINMTYDGTTNGVINNKVVFDRTGYGYRDTFYNDSEVHNAVTVIIKDYKCTDDTQNYGQIINIGGDPNTHKAQGCWCLMDRDTGTTEGIRLFKGMNNTQQINYFGGIYNETYDLIAVFDSDEAPTSLHAYFNGISQTGTVPYGGGSGYNNTETGTYSNTLPLYINCRSAGSGLLGFECTSIKVYDRAFTQEEVTEYLEKYNE